MAPSFLSIKQLRRRSRASFRTEKSTDTSSEGSNSHGPTRTPTSGSLTPPSLGHQSDPALHLQVRDRSPVPPVPARPPFVPGAASPGSSPLTTSMSASTLNIPAAGTSPSKRYSVSGMAGLGAPGTAYGNGPGRIPALPVSPYSPVITNINDNAWVYQKVLLVRGTIGDTAQQALDGTVTIGRSDDSFPPTQWPVCASHFKALVYLQPGANKLRFDFASPKLANSVGTTNPIHASYMTLHMMPPSSAPPLHLAIVLGKDSPGTFDATPARIEREGNDLDTAIRKFRMAAYLWQAFTADQMWRNRLGRRTFRFDEEWTQGTANYRDREWGQMRSEARVHVIRSDKTVAELRDLDCAQQYGPAKRKGALMDMAREAVAGYFQPPPNQKLYVSVLLLDAHWDAEAKTIRGHAALGGGGGNLQMGIFGSHCLQSYPSCFEEVVPAFSDCTPTDTAFVANDCNEAGSSWEACNIGIGAHLHETGHLLGLPHRESGVMLRDYTRLNRTFVAREAFSTRTRAKGGPVLDESEECAWHRLDCLHLRSHPCFRLPNDAPAPADESVQIWPVEAGSAIITAASGVAYVEILAEGDDVCRSGCWIEYPVDGGSGGAPPRQVTLTEQDVRSRLQPEARRKKDPVRLQVHAWGGGSVTVADMRKELFAKETTATRLTGSASSSSLAAMAVGSLPGSRTAGRTAYRSAKLGRSQLAGSQPHEVVFTSAVQAGRVLSRVIVYHGRCLDGLEFVYDDDSRQLFGKRGGKPGGDTFEMDVRRGEYISGFFVRAGFWIDGIQILTSLGRRSPIYGDASGGSAHTLVPPRGYTLCGVSGSCGDWVDGFAVLITK